MKRIFIVGSPRSGTTLAQRLIATAGDLFTYPETHFFAKMVGHRDARAFSLKRFQQPFWKRPKHQMRQALRLSCPRDWSDLPFIPRHFNNRRVPMEKLTRAFVNEFDRMASEHGLPGWVEKTPDHLHYLDEIHRYIPDAWIIHVIRSNHDVIASRKDASLIHGGHWDIYYTDLIANVDRQNTDLTRSALYVGDRRHLFVDYETLCNHTKDAITVVMDHVGISLSTPDTHLSRRAKFPIVKKVELWKHEAVKGTVKKSPSKWLQVFSEAERAKAERLLAPVPTTVRQALEDFNTLVYRTSASRPPNHGRQC